MKTNEITTIEDLRDYLTEYCAQNPEDDCIDLIQEICEANGWKWCDDLEGYDDWDYATDGEKFLCMTSEGWHVFDDENLVGYNGYEVKQSISGCWILMKDGEEICGDSACEDLNEDEETARAFFNGFLKENMGKYIVYRDNNVEEVELGAFDTLKLAKNFADKETEGYEHCGVGPEDASRPTTFRLEVTDKDTLIEVYSTDYYYED